MARKRKNKKANLNRNAIAVAHSKRGGAGSGVHSNRALDLKKGRRRHPKHKGRGW